MGRDGDQNGPQNFTARIPIPSRPVQIWQAVSQSTPTGIAVAQSPAEGMRVHVEGQPEIAILQVSVNQDDSHEDRPVTSEHSDMTNRLRLLGESDGKLQRDVGPIRQYTILKKWNIRIYRACPPTRTLSQSAPTTSERDSTPFFDCRNPGRSSPFAPADRQRPGPRAGPPLPSPPRAP